MSEARNMSQVAQSLPALIVSSEQPSWQERALCAQTDPEASFQKRVAQPAKLSEYVSPAKFAQSVLSMH
jgi:hypothetical protein